MMQKEENPFEKQLQSVIITIVGNEKLANHIRGFIKCLCDYKIYDLDDKVPVIPDAWLDKEGPQVNYGVMLIEKAHLKKEKISAFCLKETSKEDASK
jgi:hypothetical protein